MKKNVFIKILLIALCMMMVFTACAPAAKDNGKTAQTKTADLMSEVKGETWPAADALSEPFKTSVKDFSLALLKQSLSNKGNVMVSPVSVYLALGMTLNGADGETKAQMLSALQAKGLTVDKINTACRDFITVLKPTGKKTSLSVANSIWFCADFNADKNFLQKNADYFAATAQSRDFSKPETLEAINGWVNTATKGNIDKIIDDIGRDVVMYLINAVYFKSDWVKPFDGDNTQEAAFNAPSGEVQAKFMRRTEKQTYIDRKGVKGIVLPYDNKQFSFFALLPEKGQDVRAFVQSLDAKGFSSLLSSAKNGVATLSLPKFKTRYEDDLVSELKKLGMIDAFGNADLSLMSADREKDLFISNVLHKTFCNVDELGTEAAAVTAVEIPRSAGYIKGGVEITFDSPFVYGIMDTATGIPLFLGVMEDPTK